MKLKVLFIAFLCLFSAFMIDNMAMVTQNTSEGRGFNPFTHELYKGYLTTNGTDPKADPIDPPGWP